MTLLLLLSGADFEAAPVVPDAAGYSFIEVIPLYMAELKEIELYTAQLEVIPLYGAGLEEI